MNEKKRVVFDTNVLISAALLKNSVPAHIYDFAVFNYNVLYSFDTLVELTDVLFRPKFDKYITSSERKQFLNKFLIYSFELLNPQTKITDCRDAKDNKFLELAVDGKADYIITGDDDLLTLHPYRNVSIVTPLQFSDIIDH